MTDKTFPADFTRIAATRDIVLFVDNGTVSGFITVADALKQIQETDLPASMRAVNYAVDDQGHLKVTRADSTVVDLGLVRGIPGKDALPAVNGKDASPIVSSALDAQGHLVFTCADGTKIAGPALPVVTATQPVVAHGTGTLASTKRFLADDGTSWTLAEMLALASGVTSPGTVVVPVSGTLSAPSGTPVVGSSVTFAVAASAFPVYASLTQSGVEQLPRVKVDVAGSVSLTPSTAATATAAIYKEAMGGTALATTLSFIVLNQASTTPVVTTDNNTPVYGEGRWPGTKALVGGRVSLNEKFASGADRAFGVWYRRATALADNGGYRSLAMFAPHNDGLVMQPQSGGRLGAFTGGHENYTQTGLNDGNWHWVCYFQNGSNDRCYWWVDGTYCDQVYLDGTAPASSTILISAEGSTGSHFYDIDQGGIGQYADFTVLADSPDNLDGFVKSPTGPFQYTTNVQAIYRLDGNTNVAAGAPPHVYAVEDNQITTQNFPISDVLPKINGSVPPDNVTLAAGATPWFDLKFGTGAGNNVTTGQQIRDLFYLSYITGNASSAIGSPMDTGQSNAPFAAVARHYPVGDIHDLHLVTARGLEMPARAGSNGKDCSKGHIYAPIIRFPNNFGPGSTILVEYIAPKGYLAWTPIWLYTGVQFTPGPDGNPYDGFNTAAQKLQFGDRKYEIDLNDMYGRTSDGTPRGSELDFGTPDIYGTSNNVAPHATYVANVSSSEGDYVYKSDKNPPYLQMPQNFTEQTCRLILNWRDDGSNLMDVIVNGKVVWQHYMEYTPSTFVDASGVTHPVGMHLIIGNQAVPDFTPKTGPVVENDGIVDGWTPIIKRAAAWHGNVSNPDALRIVATSSNSGTSGNTSNSGGGATSQTPTITPTNSAVAQIVDNFALKNWGTTASRGFHRGGLMFAKGLVPAGTSLQIMRGDATVDAQFDRRRTWNDGSLKFAVMHMRDSDIATDTSVNYDIWTVPNTAFNNTGSITVNQLAYGPSGGTNTSEGNYKVKFQNITESDDTSTATLGSGNFVAYFSEHIGVATRVTKIHSGPVVDGYMVWGMARDISANGAGVGKIEDAHLKTVWYVDVWKNADGTQAAHEVGAVVAQDWWSVTNKKRRNYDANFTAGFGSGTVVQSYTGVSHIQQSQWLTAQMSGNNTGKRHWLGGSSPTLLYKPNKTNWVKSLVMPPIDCDHIPSRANEYTQTYVPCSAMSHRADINGTGGYMGRGVYADTDGLAFQRQTPLDTLVGRVNAMAGLGVPYHWRSNNKRTRLGESTADIANTTISPNLSVSDGSNDPYDFTSDGMPAPVKAYADYRTSASLTDGYVQPVGGEAPWNTKAYPDSSHAVSYCHFFYLHEGEPYMLEAALDLGMAGQHRLVGTDQQLSVPLGVNAPITTWSGLNDILLGQERQFSLNILASPAGVMPNDHVAFRQFDRIIQQHAKYMAASMELLPASWKLAGLNAHSATGSSPWMNGMTQLCWYQSYRLTEYPQFKAGADIMANQVINMLTDSPYIVAAYHATCTPTSLPAHAVNNIPTQHWRVADWGASVDPATDILTGGSNYPCFTVGDVIQIASYVSATPTPVPSELTAESTYYIVWVDSTNRAKFKISATLNGTPVNFSTNTDINFTCVPQIYNTFPMAYPPFMDYADGYTRIMRAALIEANANGLYKATPALLKKMEDFSSPINIDGYSCWDYKHAPVNNPAPIAPGSLSITASAPTQDYGPFVPTAPGSFTINAGDAST